MDTILHVVEIQSPADSIFEALSTEKGLSGWWSTKVSASEEKGGIVDFTFGDDFNPDMQIKEIKKPIRVSWECVAGHDPWLGSEFHFEIAPQPDGHSRLVFKQTYGGPIDDIAFGTYNYNWAYYLSSLKQLVESGTGFPYKA